MSSSYVFNGLLFLLASKLQSSAAAMKPLASGAAFVRDLILTRDLGDDPIRGGWTVANTGQDGGGGPGVGDSTATAVANLDLSTASPTRTGPAIGTPVISLRDLDLDLGSGGLLGLDPLASPPPSSPSDDVPGSAHTLVTMIFASLIPFLAIALLGLALHLGPIWIRKGPKALLNPFSGLLMSAALSLTVSFLIVFISTKYGLGQPSTTVVPIAALPTFAKLMTMFIPVADLSYTLSRLAHLLHLSQTFLHRKLTVWSWIARAIMVLILIQMLAFIFTWIFRCTPASLGWAVWAYRSKDPPGLDSHKLKCMDFLLRSYVLAGIDAVINVVIYLILPAIVFWPSPPSNISSCLSLLFALPILASSNIAAWKEVTVISFSFDKISHRAVGYILYKCAAQFLVFLVALCHGLEFLKREPRAAHLKEGPEPGMLTSLGRSISSMAAASGSSEKDTHPSTRKFDPPKRASSGPLSVLTSSSKDFFSGTIGRLSGASSSTKSLHREPKPAVVRPEFAPEAYFPRGSVKSISQNEEKKQEEKGAKDKKPEAEPPSRPTSSHEKGREKKADKLPSKIAEFKLPQIHTPLGGGEDDWKTFQADFHRFSDPRYIEPQRSPRIPTHQRPAELISPEDPNFATSGSLLTPIRDSFPSSLTPKPLSWPGSSKDQEPSEPDADLPTFPPSGWASTLGAPEDSGVSERDSVGSLVVPPPLSISKSLARSLESTSSSPDPEGTPSKSKAQRQNRVSGALYEMDGRSRPYRPSLDAGLIENPDESFYENDGDVKNQNKRDDDENWVLAGDEDVPTNEWQGKTRDEEGTYEEDYDYSDGGWAGSYGGAFGGFGIGGFGGGIGDDSQPGDQSHEQDESDEEKRNAARNLAMSLLESTDRTQDDDGNEVDSYLGPESLFQALGNPRPSSGPRKLT